MNEAFESNVDQPDSRPENANSPGMDEVLRHVLETFGTHEKAQHWLNRPNSLFGGKIPLDLLESDRDSVERELVRIDHGIFV